MTEINPPKAIISKRKIDPEEFELFFELAIELLKRKN